MEFVDHDIRGLMIRMGRSFSISELKTLMYQLLDATHFLHENCVIHRYITNSCLFVIVIF